MNEYIALFFTHSGAIKFERFVSDRDIKSNMMPAPRKLSSSCGVSVKFDFEGDFSDLVTDDVQSIYEIKGRVYEKMYECE